MDNVVKHVPSEQTKSQIAWAHRPILILLVLVSSCARAVSMSIMSPVRASLWVLAISALVAAAAAYPVIYEISPWRTVGLGAIGASMIASTIAILVYTAAQLHGVD